jgi:hypothetical protein
MALFISGKTKAFKVNDKALDTKYENNYNEHFCQLIPKFSSLRGTNPTPNCTQMNKKNSIGSQRKKVCPTFPINGMEILVINVTMPKTSQYFRYRSIFSGTWLWIALLLEYAGYATLTRNTLHTQTAKS